MRSRSLLLALFLLAVAFVGTATAAARPTQGLRYPCLTPDGKQVVFCYRGDVWVSPVDGNGPVLRLTLHEAQDTLPRVSPDGKTVAFTSVRNGNYDVFTVPITGGQPTQVTFHSAYEAVCDWSPDGKKILFTTNRAADFGRVDLYEVNLEGGTPRRVTKDGGRDASYSADGEWIVYARGYVDIYWDNYEGASNFDLYVIPAAGGMPRQLTQTRGNERYPMFSKDGKTIYFLAEEKGVANFYSMPTAGGERKKVSEYKGADVHRPDLSFDYETVVFERVGHIYATKIAAPDPKVKAMPLVVRSDVRHSGIENRTITSGGEHANVSPARGEVAFMLRGDIWVMPAGGGRGRRITSGPATDQWPRFSPDGSKIAYFSNAKGNNDIFVIDMRTGATMQVTRNPANDHFQNWSPDGKHLVFTSERSGNKDIWVLELATGLTTQLTKHSASDDDPAYSADGSQIVFDSGREGTQAIYVMNADGTGVRRITSGAAFNQVPSMSPDGRMIVYESYNPASGRSGGLYVTYIGGGPAMQISRDGQTAHWSPAGDYIYFHASRGRRIPGIYRIKAPTDVNAGELVPFIGTVEVKLRDELAALFDQAWTALRDGFYDTKMHGVNWNEMRKKYRSMAIDAENKSEFQNVVRQMLAELGASHLGIGGGQRNGSSVTPRVDQNGYLGVEFEAQTKDGFKIASILAGGPADKAGMRVGDVVTRIGRSKLGVKTNLDKLTAGTIGKDLAVTFRPLSESGLGRERTVAVKPVSLRSIGGLRRQNWGANCMRRVKEGGGGKVGYIHLSMMMPPNLMQFQQQIASLNRSRKIKGLILDVRNNGGGNIHNQLIAILNAKPLARIQVRGGPKVVQPSLYWAHPIVLLTNERSFSDAEVFPFMFKASGLGKIVGVPTAGGVIGTNDITLSDGSTFRVPRVGYWSLDGKNLEGWGIEPDFVVRETPEDRLTGRDPQLAKALEVILGEMKAVEEAKKAGKKPAVKKPPVKKPEPKPEAKPEARPEAKPEPKPAPETDGLSTLADVRVGEWVTYDVVGPKGGKSKLKVTVTDLKDGVVRFATEVVEGDAIELPLPAELRQVRVLESLAGMGKVKTHSVVDGKVKDKPAKLLLVDMEWPDGSALTLTFTNAVMAYGLLKVEMNKQVAAAEKKPEAKEPEAPDHPVYDAEVGEWVRVRRFAPTGQEVEMVLKVIEVKDEEIILSQTLKIGAREISGPERPRKRDRKLLPPDGFTLVSYGKETVTVGEHELECIVMTATGPDDVEQKWFVCPEVAVNGYVRVVRDGKTVLELLEWGSEG
jgi:tricorn protease